MKTRVLTLWQFMPLRLVLLLFIALFAVLGSVTGQVIFNYTGSIENFTVPAGVTSISIEARGAQGGNTNGGKGARMIGDFAVTPGEVLGIAVGQQGSVNNCGGAGASGGGGGGSFVWRLSNTSVPMIVAGGGGGGNTNWPGGCIAGIDAVTTQNGTQGNGSQSAMGGTDGQGGFGNAPSGTGSGGCGWLSAGQNSTHGSGSTGGQGPFTFTGGSGSTTFGPGGEGGFGGGGGAVCGCGGGGGYSGGGGGEGQNCRAGGGGGGSFNAGANQANTAGFQTGNGQVVITYSAANDLCANATPIACGGTAGGSTATANNDGPTLDCNDGSTAPDVWYSIVGTGGNITASLCGSGYDTQIDVYTGACDALTNIGGCSDDFCGTQSQMTWASTFGVTYLIRVHGFAGATGAFTLNVTCTSAEPCASPIETIACETPKSVTLSGSGAGWSPNSCGFATSGAEKVYSFTPTVTGMHTLQVTATNSTYINYFFKDASGGCGANGWTCIDDISTPTSVTFGPLTAGSMYLILLDDENSLTSTATFQINCPIDPCETPIETITCETPKSVTLSGSGAGWSPNSCGFSTPGAEKVYSFTPTVTGMHTLQVTATNATYIDYFFKDASGGCGANGWACIDDISTPTSVTFGPLTAGVTYLILLDDESTSSSTATFQINCPPACPAFSAAPPNVDIVNSTCGSGCTLTGGSITAPTGTPCPAGSTLQYNVNNTGWTTSLPSYNQAGPAQSIRTRCSCDNDANIVSAESNPVSTVPGTLANPVVPANGSAIVACPALATQPTPPAVTGCDGSPITPTGPVVTNNPSPLTCEGTRTYTWTYSCGSTSSTWSFVYTIERNPFTVPANGAATVNSPTLAIQPTPPVVTSNCGEVLTPTGPVVTNNPNPIVCTGTRTYAWTYTDCEGNTAVWSFVYTIIDNTPPMATCHNQTITFNGQESITLNANDLVTVSDNCGTPSITLSPSFITCQQVGQMVPVTITVKDASNNTVTCTANVTVGGLPCGWSQQANGVNCTNGNSIAYNAATGVYTATSTNCFYGPPFTGDATAFAQRTLCGNGSITALVTGINPLAGGWAGIVMRENNTAGAKKAQLMTNLGSDHRREFRIATNGSAQVQQFPSQSRYWLRITRVGNQFTMFVSSNGVNWFPAGAQNIAMPSCIQIGLVATNYTANSTVTATFSNVSFTGSSGTLALPGGGEAALAPHSSLLTPDFEVYPNPTGGDLNVDLSHYVGRAVRLEVYSLEGKLLQFSELDEVQNTLERLDLKGLQNGMYLVKVKSAGLPDATRRVVLTRG